MIWYGEFPNKESYPHRMHVWSVKVEDTNCIIASTDGVDRMGFTQLRIDRRKRVALIRFDSDKSKAPYPFEKAKILWDSRKSKKG